MTTMPDIPRLYTALAECLAVLLYARGLPQRFNVWNTLFLSVAWASLLSVFLAVTGEVPLEWWIPCMGIAIGISYLYLWMSRKVSLLETGYHCARAFLLAETAASLEWQLHCALWPERSASSPEALGLLVLAYAALFSAAFYLEYFRPRPEHRPQIGTLTTITAILLAATAFAVSNLSFLNGSGATLSVLYIRTLVDLAGVLILTLQNEQLQEDALHRELKALDEVLHRQYEQYKRSKEGIQIINTRYHELKVQIASIRAERDQIKQDAALARMESGIRQYEAENKTGNPVLDTLLTAKSIECQKNGIRMTSVADGSSLGFLSTRDLCTMVGVPLDNAIESLTAEPCSEKRLLRVAIYTQNGFLMLRFENYCSTPVALGRDGLPALSAHGGYDLKSVRAAAQQYEGAMTLHWEDKWFVLRILLPLGGGQNRL